MPSWESLPRDALVAIYASLDFDDLLRRVPFTCMSWYKASKDPSLWREVDLHDFPKEPTKLIEFIIERSQGSLTSIDFPETANFDHLLMVARECPGLKSFIMYNTSDAVYNKSDAVSGINTDLYHTGVAVYGIKTEKFCNAVTQLKELQSMEVTSCFLSDASTVHQISLNCPNLTKLRLHNFVDHDIVFNIITFLPKLKEIIIDDTADATDLLSIIIHSKDLEVLCVGPESVISFQDFISNILIEYPL